MIITKYVKQRKLPVNWRFVILGEMVRLAKSGAGEWEDFKVGDGSLRQEIDRDEAVRLRSMNNRYISSPMLLKRGINS